MRYLDANEVYYGQGSEQLRFDARLGWLYDDMSGATFWVPPYEKLYCSSSLLHSVTEWAGVKILKYTVPRNTPKVLLEIDIWDLSSADTKIILFSSLGLRLRISTMYISLEVPVRTSEFGSKLRSESVYITLISKLMDSTHLMLFRNCNLERPWVNLGVLSLSCRGSEIQCQVRTPLEFQGYTLVSAQYSSSPSSTIIDVPSESIESVAALCNASVLDLE